MRKIFIAFSTLCPKGGISSNQRTLETVLKSVVHQLPGGHGSPLKKTFEGQAMMERGREEGPS